MRGTPPTDALSTVTRDRTTRREDPPGRPRSRRRDVDLERQSFNGAVVGEAVSTTLSSGVEAAGGLWGEARGVKSIPVGDGASAFSPVSPDRWWSKEPSGGVRGERWAW